jgi:transcriptional regulator with GAF, ATPase, and Fis domain
MASAPTSQGSSDSTFKLPEGGVVLSELERDLVRQALERSGGNQTRAAQLLGMTRDQIRYRADKGVASGVPE